MDIQTKEKVRKVVIGIPTEGHTLPEAYDNHLIHSYRMGIDKSNREWENEIARLKKMCGAKLGDDFPLSKKAKFNPVRYEYYWYTVGRILTPLAREKLATEAVKKDMDYLIQYDDDMVLPPGMATYLLDVMEKHPEIDVLAPLAFMRSDPHYAVMYNVVEGYDSNRHQAYYFNQFVKNYPKDKLVECDAVGFGASCIRVSLLRRMKEPYFMSTTNTGEDIWFCVNAKQQAKARIFMDTRCKLGHIGNPPIITEETRDIYIKENKEDIGSEPLKYNSYDK